MNVSYCWRDTKNGKGVILYKREGAKVVARKGITGKAAERFRGQFAIAKAQEVDGRSNPVGLPLKHIVCESWFKGESCE